MLGAPTGRANAFGGSIVSGRPRLRGPLGLGARWWPVYPGLRFAAACTWPSAALWAWEPGGGRFAQACNPASIIRPNGARYASPGRREAANGGRPPPWVGRPPPCSEPQRGAANAFGGSIVSGRPRLARPFGPGSEVEAGLPRPALRCGLGWHSALWAWPSGPLGLGARWRPVAQACASLRPGLVARPFGPGLRSPGPGSALPAGCNWVWAIVTGFHYLGCVGVLN